MNLFKAAFLLPSIRPDVKHSLAFIPHWLSLMPLTMLIWAWPQSAGAKTRIEAQFLTSVDAQTSIWTRTFKDETVSDKVKPNTPTTDRMRTQSLSFGSSVKLSTSKTPLQLGLDLELNMSGYPDSAYNRFFTFMLAPGMVLIYHNHHYPISPMFRLHYALSYVIENIQEQEFGVGKGLHGGVGVRLFFSRKAAIFVSYDLTNITYPNAKGYRRVIERTGNSNQGASVSEEMVDLEFSKHRVGMVVGLIYEVGSRAHKTRTPPKHAKIRKK